MEEEFPTEQIYTLKNVVDELDKINKKINSIENNLNSKMDSLVDLLRDIVSTHLKQINTSSNTSFSTNCSDTVVIPDLYYTTDEEFIFIKGKKTYQNKDKIKSMLNGVWNKEKNCWSFRKYANFEEKLKETFPDITEGQS